MCSSASFRQMIVLKATLLLLHFTKVIFSITSQHYCDLPARDATVLCWCFVVFCCCEKLHSTQKPARRTVYLLFVDPPTPLLAFVLGACAKSILGLHLRARWGTKKHDFDEAGQKLGAISFHGQTNRLSGRLNHPIVVTIR